MKTKPRLITARLLRAHGACADQVRIFRKTFPEGTPVTLSACRKAAKAGLLLDWAADNLLSAAAWKVYNEARAAAWKVYNEARAAAHQVCDEAKAAAWVCNEAGVAAYKIYDEAKAPAFYCAWKSQKCDQ